MQSLTTRTLARIPSPLSLNGENDDDLERSWVCRPPNPPREPPADVELGGDLVEGSLKGKDLEPGCSITCRRVVRKATHRQDAYATEIKKRKAWLPVPHCKFASKTR